MILRSRSSALPSRTEVLATRELTTIVTRRGQITLPAEIRKARGIREGDRIALLLENDQVRLRGVSGVVTETAGIFKNAVTAGTAEELRRVAEEAIAADVAARSNS
jgi:AbrB family looped-hinge helix DNA binding protein